MIIGDRLIGARNYVKNVSAENNSRDIAGSGVTSFRRDEAASPSPALDLPPSASNLSADEIKLQQLDKAVPVLMQELAAGKTHRFKGLGARSLIATVIGEDAERGLRSTYFSSPDQLASFVGDMQGQLDGPSDQKLFVTGALMVSKSCHHAAVVGVIKKREAAIIVLDSVPDLRATARRTRNPYTRLKQAALARLGGYDNTTFTAFRNQPNTSVYYTYLGTQASMTDCAAFTVASVRHILSDPTESRSYYDFLDQRAQHVSAAEEPLGLNRIVRTPNSTGSDENTNFVLHGDECISPAHYIHTQSKNRLKKYCAASPFVQQNPAWKTFLLEQHRQHRRTMKPLLPFAPRFTAKQANISIRQEQIHALIEAREQIQARIDDKLSAQ